jgi:hypothetical protein
MEKVANAAGIAAQVCALCSVLGLQDDLRIAPETRKSSVVTV